MFKKIATAAVLTGGMLIMGGTAFADNSAMTGDDWSLQKFTAKHGTCSMQDSTRVCGNWTGGEPDFGVH